MSEKDSAPASILPVSPAQVPPPARERVWLIGALALAALHFLWLTAHLAPAIMSPDANGYVVQARLIANEGRTSFSPASPVQYVGMHWLETEGGVFHSRYPAGLPLLFAAAWKTGGLRAALFVNPLLASATVFLVFLLARRLVGAGFALLAAAVIATVPVANQHALDADAHIATAFFLVGGILALLRFEESRAPGVGLVAGILLGMVPAVRYPEAIVGVTVGVWLLWRVRPVVRVWPAVVGAALPLVALFAHNAAAYGAFWRTGYALTNEQTGFGLGFFASHVLPYLQGLGGQGLALFFAFGAAGIAALAVDGNRRAVGVLFAGIVVPVVLLYMAYYFGAGGMGGGAGGNLRFLIPTFPFFAVAGVWLLARVAEHLGAPGRAAVAVVVALQAVVGVGASVQMLAQAKTSLNAAARASAVAEKEIPAGSVVIVERTLAESLDAVGRWKLVEENFVAGMGPGGRGGPPGRGGPGGAFPPLLPGGDGPRESGAGAARPNPQQIGKNRAQQERYADVRGAERRERIWSDVSAWAEGRPVFWFARTLEAVEMALPPGADYHSVAEIDAPMMMGPGGGGPRMPGAMAGGMPGRGGPGGMGRGMGGGNFGPPGAVPGPMVEPGAGRGPQNFGGGRGPGAKLRLVRIELAKK